MITTQVSFGDFWDWLQSSDGYKHNFTYDGAKALFEYLEDYSEETGEVMEYDPVAWCVEFTQYDNLQEVKGNYNDIESEDDLLDATSVIGVPNSESYVIQDF